MSLVRLPYLGKDVLGEIYESPRGYSEVKGIDLYNNASIRNNVIVKIDLLKYLNEHFSIETINAYRSALYYIIAGYGNDTDESKSTINGALLRIYKDDEVFKLKLAKIFYFRGVNLDHLPVYDALLEDIKRHLEKVKVNVQKVVDESKMSNSLLFEHELYLYYSISSYTFDINKANSITGLEVVSKC